MTTKRFLVPVLALLACGLPAGATLATYCDGASVSCTNTAGSFNSAGLLAINFTSASIVSNSFTDPGSLTFFQDFTGGVLTNPSNALTDSKDGFQINLPANTLILAFNYLIQNGGNLGICVMTTGPTGCTSFSGTSSSTPTFFGVTSDLNITEITITGNTGPGTISNFELQGPVGSETPEVGTLLLIGTGLIVMRWMKRRPRLLFRIPQTA